MMQSRSSPALAGPLLLFCVWTVATWLLEGRNETLLRGDASARAIYALVANLFIAVGGAALLLRTLIGRGLVESARAGFGRRALSPRAIGLAIVAGWLLFWIQGAPATSPVTFANAFAQVLVVSTAEVLVCWAAAGAAVEAALRRHGGLPPILGATVVSSILFGVYHFAHSPPFNTFGMVALLTLVGLATSGAFFGSRSVYATIIFHNFLGVFGVLQALATAGKLDSLDELRLPLLGMGLASIAALAGAHHWITRWGVTSLDGQSGRG